LKLAFTQSILGILIFTTGMQDMSETSIAIPPFDIISEREIIDNVFQAECDHSLGMILEDSQEEIVIVNSTTTMNEEFGPVCRFDFRTPYDSKEAVNRIMLWRLPSGEIGNFIGFDVPAKILK